MNLREQIEMVRLQQPDNVAAMRARIDAALLDRANFERAKKPNGTHIDLRKVANDFSTNGFAAFLHVINADPDLMLNRVRKNGYRANLKGLIKVRKLYEYIAGHADHLERVSFALFACTIIAAHMGIKWVASNEQEFILSDERVRSLPRNVQEAIDEYKHKHMTLEGDSRPQSCAFRTTYANLGAYYFAREDFDNSDYTLGIMVDLQSPIVSYLSNRWQLERFAQ